MRGLEAGLRVGDIATYDLVTCGAQDHAARVMADPAKAAFECIPVRHEGHIVGVLERRTKSVRGTARSTMRPLDDALLVSAGEPLKRFIPVLAESPYRLVVRGARIEGIVTRSDVHKLPVRLLAFALVTHLEMMMTDAIARTSQADDWLGCLNENRRLALLSRAESLQTTSLDPPLLELAEFCDKRDILAKRGLLDPSKAESLAEFKRIEGLRNRVAHAAKYAQDADKLRAFVDLLGLTESWIEKLSRVYEPDT